MKRVRGMALLLVLLVAACGGENDNGEAERVQTVTRDQQLFYTLDAGTKWIAAVGRDAQYRATSAAARTYAATLAADHEGIATALERASQQADVRPTESGLGRELLQAAQAARSALQGMSGPEYDLAFVETAIRLQQRLLSGIDRDLAVLQNPALRQIAEQSRPTLEAHIRRGRQLLPEMRLAEASGPPPAPSATPGRSSDAAVSRPPAQRPATSPTPRTPPRTAPDTPSTARTPPRTPPDTSRPAVSTTPRDAPPDTTAH